MTTVVPEQRSDRSDGRAAAEPAEHDLVFVGAGASSAYVLMSLLSTLPDRVPASALRIAVVEREPDPFAGVAYGGRAAKASLLITSLRDFLPDDERTLFVEWLTANKGWVFDELRQQGGAWSADWWARHEAEIGRDDFDPVYLPRYVFGVYLAQRTWAAIDLADKRGLAVTRVTQDEVTAIEAVGDSYLLRCRGQDVRARRVVLATGSPPVLARLDAGTPAPAAALVDDPFADMGAALDVVRTGLRHRARAGGNPPHVALIGGNAGVMDMLYAMNDLDLREIEDTMFTVLSPRGQLPERIDERVTPNPFAAERLQALERAGAVAAADVFQAALADITRGRETGMSVHDTLRPVSQGVGRLLPRLSADEALEFAGYWGNELGRYQRRAGWEYCAVVERLAGLGRIRMVAGSFAGVRTAGPAGVHVNYERDGVLHALPSPADVVINCAGPARRIQDGGSALLTQLVTSGLCLETSFGGGIAVDADLAAAPGLHVMGPLLAGNLVNGAPLWHMEHCGRISAYGTALGADLARSLVPV